MECRYRIWMGAWPAWVDVSINDWKWRWFVHDVVIGACDEAPALWFRLDESVCHFLWWGIFSSRQIMCERIVLSHAADLEGAIWRLRRREGDRGRKEWRYKVSLCPCFPGPPLLSIPFHLPSSIKEHTHRPGLNLRFPIHKENHSKQPYTYPLIHLPSKCSSQNPS